MEIIATFVPDPDRDPREGVSRPPAGATMTELRADLLDEGADVAALVAASPLPVVLTLRSAAEGGRGPGDEAARRSFFTACSTLPVALFDLEAARDAALLGAVIPAERAIVSAHLGGGVPADLEERAHALLAHGSRLVKLVPAASTLADVLSVLALARGFENGDPRARRGIVFASGTAAVATRLLGPLLGAPVAYAAWEEGREAAAGQLPAAELAFLVSHLSGRPRRLFAVVGRPVHRSLSPAMHTAAYRALGLPNLMVPMEVNDAGELDELVAPQGSSCIDRLGLPLGGLAVTMPWKEEAARRCDVVAPRAARARAVNTVIPRTGKVLGDCTDIDGLTGALQDAGAEPGGARALVLGTGGAARAAAVALDLAGAEVALAGRDAGRARAAADALGVGAAGIGGAEGFDIVVNATPAGGDGTADAMLEGLRCAAGTVVVDLPYGAAPTFLELLAPRREWAYVSGRDVLLFQGIAQFAAMNQMPPPVRAMAAAVGLEEVQ